MSKDRWKIISLFVILLMVGTSIQVNAASRPKIGLALGGGSAMGFTHIGVLQWLEENRIPVDYITGTSMGGLIGGCCAMGMSAHEIADLVKSVDWNTIFNSTPPYRLLNFRNKENLLEFPTEIEVGAKERIHIPNGLTVYQIDFLLSRITLPYSMLPNFDALPIPYRCVAADIRNSQAVILKDGSLAQAMRATMSIPALFAPVERDGKLLVDGGMVNNVPADVVRQLGADQVIAVNCNESNAEKDLSRMDSFLMAAINAVVVKNTSEALQSADVVINVANHSISYYDWKAVDRYIAIGYQAAAEQSELLKKYALSEEDWQEYLKRRDARKQKKALIPQKVEIIGASAMNQDTIFRRVRHYLNEPLDPMALEATLTELMASGFYESIRYELQERSDGSLILVIQVKEKTYGPPFVRMGAQLDIGGDRTDANLRLRITDYNIMGSNSELRTDLGVGTAPFFRTEMIKPFIGKGLFAAGELFFEQTNNSLFQNDIRINDYKIMHGGLGMDLGYTFNRFCELRVGFQVSNQQLETTVGPILPKLDGNVNKVCLKWSLITTDDPGIPHNGVAWNVQADWYQEAPSANGPFSLGETSFHWFSPWGNTDILVTTISSGITFSGETPLLQQFTLGGPFRLANYDRDQKRGNNYVYGSVGFLKSLGQQAFINGNLYFGVFLENGGVFADWADCSSATDVAMGLVGKASFGTVYLGTSFGPAKQSRLYLLIGNLF